MKTLLFCALAAAITACNANNKPAGVYGAQDSTSVAAPAPLQPVRIAIVWDAQRYGLEVPNCTSCSGGGVMEFAADSCVRRAFTIEAHKDGVQYLYPTDGYAVAYMTVMR